MSTVIFPTGETYTYDPNAEYSYDTKIQFELNNKQDEGIIQMNMEHIDKLRFTYALNDKIKIGQAHKCAFMIYLGCIGEVFYDEGPIQIDERTLDLSKKDVSEPM